MEGGEYFNWVDVLPQNVRQALLDKSKVIKFAAGTTLYERVAPPTGLFRIDEGRVRLFLLKDTGTEFLLKICSQGETVGDLASIDGLPYPVFAEAMTDVVTTFIPVKDLNDLRRRHPEIDSVLVQLLAGTARGVISLLERVTMHSIEKQVAGRLLWLVRSQRLRGIDTNTVKLSQGDLALMLSASRQTVNKALARLEAMALITRQYGNITIADDDRIDKFLGQPSHL